MKLVLFFSVQMPVGMQQFRNTAELLGCYFRNVFHPCILQKIENTFHSIFALFQGHPIDPFLYGALHQKAPLRHIIRLYKMVAHDLPAHGIMLPDAFCTAFDQFMVISAVQQDPEQRFLRNDTVYPGKNIQILLRFRDFL